jgi:hypothetical protein
MMLMLLAQSATEIERARYLSGVRFFWLLVTIFLILGIVLLVKKLWKS